jgi:hypothetical protein
MTRLPLTSTIIFLSCFLAGYVLVLARNTVRKALDVTDFVLLTSVAVVPACFAYFPTATLRLSHFIGVEFPFVVIFGSLFFILFVLVYTLIVRIEESRRRTTTLVQENGLLRMDLEALGRRLAEIEGRTRA